MSTRPTEEAGGDEGFRQRDNSDAACRPRVDSRIEDAASDRDRRWFAANPHRELRLRFALPGELGLDVPPASVVMLVHQLEPGVRVRGMILRYWLDRFPAPDSLPDDDTLRHVVWTARGSPALVEYAGLDWGRAFGANRPLSAEAKSRFDLWLATAGGTA